MKKKNDWIPFVSSSSGRYLENSTDFMLHLKGLNRTVPGIILSEMKLVSGAFGDHCLRGTNVFTLSVAVFTLHECVQSNLIKLTVVFLFCFAFPPQLILQMSC